MKPTLLILSCLFFVNEICIAQPMNDPTSIRKAVENVRVVSPEGFSDPSKIRNTAEYKSLVASAPSIWMAAMGNLESSAPTREDQEILFQSFEGLSASDYLQFLNRALDLYDQGKIDLGTFTYSVFFSGGNMQFFISHNYNHPEVAAFLKKAEDVLEKKGEPLMFNVQEARSGKLKELNDAARARHPDLAKLPVPLLRVPDATLSDGTKETPLVGSTSPNSPAVVQSPESVGSSKPSSPTAESKSTPWPWIIGAILLLAVAGGILLKLRRK
jgi:hypothetical protein